MVRGGMSCQVEVVWCEVAFGSEGLIGISKTAEVGWKRAADRRGAGRARFLKQRLLQPSSSVRCVERRGGGEAGRGPGPGASADEGEHRFHLVACVWACLGARSCPSLCDSPRGLAHQAPLSMGFRGQEYCSGLPFPPPGALPNPGMEPTSLASPAWQAGSLHLAPSGKPPYWLWVLSGQGTRTLQKGLLSEGHGRGVHMEQWRCQRVGVF